MSTLHDLAPSAKRSIFISVLFGITQVVASVVGLWSNSVISDFIEDEASVGMAGLERVDQVSGIWAIAFLLVFIAMIIINGRWIYLASANAAIAVPHNDRIRPGWAIGWFFVPFANLVMPYKAMKQTWSASVGGGTFDSATPGWLIIWWLSWVALNLSDGISSNVLTRSNTLESLIAFNTYSAFSGFLWLIPTYLFIRIVKEVTAAQHSAADVFA